MRSDTTLKKGKTVAERYKMARLLEASKNAEFWQGIDTNSRARITVSLYKLDAGDHLDEARERFSEYMERVSHLLHENILTLYDYGHIKQRGVFAVTEDSSAPTLETLLQGDELEAQWVVDIFRELASGLQAAHDKDYIHGDLRPSLIRAHENTSRPVKIDGFGLGRIIRQFRRQSLIDTETDFYGPFSAYMAPEQNGENRLGPWTDMYSFGLIFHEALTHSTLVDGDAAKGEESADETLKLEELEQFPVEIRPVIKKLVAADPEDRYQDAGTLYKDLNRIEVTKESAYSGASIDPKTGKVVDPSANKSDVMEAFGSDGDGESSHVRESSRDKDFDPKVKFETNDLTVDWEKKQYDSGGAPDFDANPSQKTGDVDSHGRQPPLKNSGSFSAFLRRTGFVAESLLALVLTFAALYVTGLWIHDFSVDTRIWIGLTPVIVSSLARFWLMFSPETQTPSIRRSLVILSGLLFLAAHIFALETLKVQIGEQPLWFMERLQALPFRETFRAGFLKIVNIYEMGLDQLVATFVGKD
jgi:serine/threonine protein kinase